MFTTLCIAAVGLSLHDGPDPVLSDSLRATDVVRGELRAQFGPAIPLEQEPLFIPASEGGGAELAGLYGQHGVEMVLTGHIHSYERRWPIEGGRVVDDGGAVYTITGGGGGGLETPSPTRPAFNNTVRGGTTTAGCGSTG